jgi:hypothetical protein
MNVRRDVTGHRDWPWERPHEELIQMEHAELHLLVAIGRALVGLEANQRTISRHLAAIRHKEIDEMATLEDVQALVVQTGVDAQETADRVIAAIAAATGDASATIADLQAQVAALIAGNAADITPEQLQSVADGLTAVDATIKGIAPAPVVEPPVV